MRDDQLRVLTLAHNARVSSSLLKRLDPLRVWCPNAVSREDSAAVTEARSQTSESVSSLARRI